MNKEDEIVQTLVSQKVYDPFLRFLHIWNGLCVFGLILTIWFKNPIKQQIVNGSDAIYLLHVFIGFALTTGIILRIIWGLFGPKHARFSSMWFFSKWLRVLKTRKLEESSDWGHDAYASLAYLAFYFMMIYQVVSGLAFAAKKFGIGPFVRWIPHNKDPNQLLHNLKEIHEIFYYISMIYIVVHVGMILIHESRSKLPIAQSMLSGLQFRRKK